MTKNNIKPDIHVIQIAKAKEETQQQQHHHKLLLLNFFTYMCTQQASGTFIL
jgi:hypothetical protein